MHVGTPQTRHMHAMAKPQFYEFIRKHRENRLLLRDYAKTDQLASGRFISEDLLIRSNREIHMNILPFLKHILAPADHPVNELAIYKRYGGSG